jgi:hypothetical protein
MRETFAQNLDQYRIRMVFFYYLRHPSSNFQSIPIPMAEIPDFAKNNLQNSGKTRLIGLEKERDRGTMAKFLSSQSTMENYGACSTAKYL